MQARILKDGTEMKKLSKVVPNRKEAEIRVLLRSLRAGKRPSLPGVLDKLGVQKTYKKFLYSEKDLIDSLLLNYGRDKEKKRRFVV